MEYVNLGVRPDGIGTEVPVRFVPQGLILLITDQLNVSLVGLAHINLIVGQKRVSLVRQEQRRLLREVPVRANVLFVNLDIF